MSSSNKTVYRSHPRHANLRTQQRRLRHIRSLAVRALKPSIPVQWDTLSVSVLFTLHVTEADDAFYTSSHQNETYNPTWGSLYFTYEAVGEIFSNSQFIVKVWLNVSNNDEYLLCCEKSIDLSKYVFMGINVDRRDHLNYPFNSIIVGTSDGYYISRDIGVSLPLTQRPRSDLFQYLPQNSLMEVRRHEVTDSYQLDDLKRLLIKQRRLNMLRRNIKQIKDDITNYRLKYVDTINKRNECTSLKVRVDLLKNQLQRQQSSLLCDKDCLSQTRKRLDQRESKFHEMQQSLVKEQAKLHDDSLLFSQRRETLINAQKKLYIRQRTLIAELSQTFCIRQLNETFTICDVILPHGDPMESAAASAEQTAVALGFVAHLVQLLSQFLLVPLQYPIQCNGSRTTIIDNIHIGLDIKEFPLYIKGTEKSLYQFGLYLLWRNILQLRQHCGYSNSKSSAKKTLLNLKNLLDKLMMDKYSIFPLRGNDIVPSLTATSSPASVSFYSPSEFNDSLSQSPPHEANQSPVSMIGQEEWLYNFQASPRNRSSALLDSSKMPVLDVCTSPRFKRKEKSSFDENEDGRKTAYTLNIPRPFSNIDTCGIAPLSCPVDVGFIGSVGIPHANKSSNSQASSWLSEPFSVQDQFPLLEDMSRSSTLDDSEDLIS